MLLLALLSWSTIASAQERRAYIGGAFTMASWKPHSVNGGSPSTDTNNTSTDTTATGVVGEVGWFFNRSGSVGVEIGVPFGRATETSTASYFQSYLSVSRYREQTIFGVLSGQTPATGRVRLALVGGGGVVRGSSLYRSASGKLGTTDFGPLSAEQEGTHTFLGFTGGADLSIEATSHISIVPQFHILVIRRGPIVNTRNPLADLGLPSVVYRMGIGIRAAF